MSTRRVLLRLSPIVLISFSGPSTAAQGQFLTLGVHPFLPKSELTRRFTPLAKYLEKKLNVPIKIKISRDYEAHIELVGSSSLDIVYLGPASYVELTRRYGMYPLLARLEVNGSPTFHGVIVVRQDSAIQKLAQLKGRRFAFGSVKSTMSYLVPRRMLQDAGVRMALLQGHGFLRNHQDVALGVLLGEYDAGAVKEEVYEKYKERGLRVLAKSPAVSEHLFVASRQLDKRKLGELRSNMYDIANSEDGLRCIKSIKPGVSRLVRVRDKDYDSLRTLLYRP